jgi:hypothetical protein
VESIVAGRADERLKWQREETVRVLVRTRARQPQIADKILRHLIPKSDKVPYSFLSLITADEYALFGIVERMDLADILPRRDQLQLVTIEPK